MTKYADLIKTEEYWTTHFQTLLYEAVDDYLKKTGKKKSAFADEIGVSKGYVSQVLNGDADHKISTFVRFVLASGLVPSLNLITVEEYLEKQKKTAESCEISVVNVDIPSSKEDFFNNISSRMKIPQPIKTMKIVPKNLEVKIGYQEENIR